MARKKKKYFTLGFSLLLLVLLWILTQQDRATDIENMSGVDTVVTPPAEAPEPEPEVRLIRGVVLDDIESAELDPEFNFGKGRLGAFTFTAPHDGNFRIEELIVAAEGVRAGDMDAVWLSVNGLNVFSTASFDERSGQAVFTQFPPITEPGTAPDAVTVDAETQILESPQQTQYMIVRGDPLPQVVASGDDIRIVLYGHWDEGISPRPVGEGIRLCLLGIRGSVITLVGENQFEEVAAETKFAAPECWNMMGIEA